LSEWQHHVNQPNVAFWVAYVSGNPIGYFEIKHGHDSASEICLFGLMPNWVGRGLGSDLLQDAIHQAFKPGQRRVWLHTCSLDHPNALPNYTKHGFNLFKEERFMAKVPAEPLEPFPGAYSP
jgi:ribosomal protein S18 acetylase RimI-like enzyme